MTDPILETLTGAGEPFELARDAVGRVQFARAPRNLRDLLSECRRHGDATCLVEADRRLSYAQSFERADALAAQLAGEFGIGAGDHVGIAMRNGIDWAIAFLALVATGAVAVLVNSRLAPPALRSTAEATALRLILADDRRSEMLGAAGCRIPILRARDFRETGRFQASADRDADAPAAILFTSGTTGFSKGAVLTHRNLVTGLMSVQLAGLMVLHNLARDHGIPPDVLLAKRGQAATLLVFPLFHISGLAAGLLSTMLAGGKVVVMSRWEAQAAAMLVERERITALAGVPTMIWDLLNRADLGQCDLSSLANIGTGGQALPVNLVDAIARACPHAVIGSGYGMTETTGTVAMAMGREFLRKRASSGRVMPIVDVRIVGEDGTILPAGAVGEIHVRGATVMQRYWGQPAETADVLDAEGWLKTGDVGRIDDEGFLFIVDRKKDMVISGGENIYCAEVERVLCEDGRVVECAAFGIPDPRLGERLVAVVAIGEARPDPSEEEMRALVAANLAAYKAPTRIVFTRNPLPRNAVGKIDKASLRDCWERMQQERTE
jgi:long-chain acyl-CoA synthetase